MCNTIAICRDEDQSMTDKYGNKYRKHGCLWRGVNYLLSKSQILEVIKFESK